MTLEIVKTAKDLGTIVSAWRDEGLKVGLVPTMGALHGGHLSLVKQILDVCDRAVVSIFVNPTQFGEGEDFAKYPKKEKEDLEKLEAAGAHLVYMPTVDEMYPKGAKTIPADPALSEVLCGKFRPRHFGGVATIVAKLFLQGKPDTAIFGEKDYQQLQVIRRMTKNQKLRVKVLAAPTVREADGLAMSSRNVYLSDENRKIAALLPETLTYIIEQAKEGSDLLNLTEEAKATLIAGGFDAVDYIEFREGDTLAASQKVGAKTRLFAAAHIAATRLIDNMPVRKP